ncbi:glycosyltransferase family 2 [Klosneuvirus KNV1]|uniref:Glycosyltransferase family 2 n=1 Tax=Klosneuvirus KNV1 TaxID=1977640 RepID=A0A1V0SJD8_9VIRU|nr:glycosyltransferase family 2 [Klosneuvirus KNV1]
MKTTLFAHILNEEILLPSWLNHHKKLFSHGVIMDCGSTDKSIQIINDICPTWEIIQLTNDEIKSMDIQKIEDMESKTDGWKCALNVSEYLIIDDLNRYLKEFENNNPNSIGVRATGIIIVDQPNNTSIQQFNDPNLMLKKNYGYVEFGRAWNGEFREDGIFPTTTTVYRSRLIHKNKTGEYTAGRHDTRLSVSIDPNLYIAWIGRGSPELYSKRCNIWKHPPSGILLFHGNYYNIMSNTDLAFKFWGAEVMKSINIFDNIPKYRRYLEILYGTML